MRICRVKFFIAGFRTNVKGASLVEFSLLLPILIGLMGGVIEFGRAFQQHHVANKGVTNAGRYLARVLNDTLCDGTPGGTWTADVADAKRLAQKGTFVNSDPYLLSNWNDSSTFTATISCVNNPTTAGVTTYRGPDTLPVITVSTTFQYDDIGMMSIIKIPSLTITASHTELYIGG